MHELSGQNVRKSQLELLISGVLFCNIASFLQEEVEAMVFILFCFLAGNRLEFLEEILNV